MSASDDAPFLGESALEAQAKQMLDLLERPAELMGSEALGRLEPQILAAFLKGSSWAESFDAFFLDHSAIFADFTIGAEHTFRQTDVHRKFVSAAEGLLEAQLAEKAVSAGSFLSQLMTDASGGSGLGAAKPAAAIMRRLEECIDFQKFGLMMRQRHERVFSEIGQLEQAKESLQAHIDMATARGQQPQVLSQISQLEQAKESLQDQLDAAKARALVQQNAHDELGLAREQQAIRDASERRRRAREGALRRAAETEAAMDADAREITPEPEPEPEPQPEPKPQPEPQSSAFGGWTSWQSHPARMIGDGWEVGSEHTGAVSYWDASAGWGKIKRMAVGGQLHALGIPQIGADEIFVHNLQLPMDAPKRWLRRGEAVQFTVGVTLAPKGPQAMRVVGIGADGIPGSPLLCQQPPLL